MNWSNDDENEPLLSESEGREALREFLEPFLYESPLNFDVVTFLRSIITLTRRLEGFAVWTMTNDRSFKLFAALTRDEQVHAAQWNEFVATHRVIDLENHFANAASLEHWLVGGIQSGSLAGSRVASYSATPIYYRGEPSGVLVSFWNTNLANPLMVDQARGFGEILADMIADHLDSKLLWQDRFIRLVRTGLMTEAQAKAFRQHCGGEIAGAVASALREHQISPDEAMSWEIMIDVGYSPEEAKSLLTEAKRRQLALDGGLSPPANPRWVLDFLPLEPVPIADSAEMMQRLWVFYEVRGFFGGIPGTGRRGRRIHR